MAADFGSPVVNPNAPTAAAGGMSLLKGILGLQQQRQDLETGAYKQQETQAGAQQAQQQMQERLAVQKMMQSGEDDQGNSIRAANGQPDPAKLLPALGRVAPLTGQAYAQSILKTHSDKVALQTATTALDAQQRNMISGLAGAAINDPNANSKTFGAAVDDLVKQHPEMQVAADRAKSLASHIDTAQDPAQKSRMWSSLQALMQTPQPVPTAPIPGKIDTESQIIPGATNPQTGQFTPAQGGISRGIRPGYSTVVDQRTGNIYYQNDQNPNDIHLAGYGPPAGRAGGVAAGPNAAGQPSNANASGPDVQSRQISHRPNQPNAGGDANRPPVFTPGEADVLKSNTDKATENRRLAQDAQTQGDILGRIQSLAATPGLYVGPGSDKVGQLATTVAQIPGFEGAAKYANNYNELIKFMAQNAARQGAQMGLQGSDSRLDLALHSQPNTAQDARTIRDVSQYLSGLVRMQLAKADSMDRWLQQPGNSLRNEQHFEQLWRDNADPRLFQLAEMKDQNDAGNYARLHIRNNETSRLTEKHKVLQQLGALP